MKKLILALAATAALGAAQAQSNVTVYGVVDAAYHSSETFAQKSNGAGTTTKSSGLANSNLAGNRLGVRGSEDLGNGLTAKFVTEWSVNMIGDGAFTKVDGGAQPTGNKTTDAGATAPFNRQSYVALSSAKAGEVRLGWQTTAQYDHNALFTAGYEGAAGARNHLDIMANNAFGNTVTNAEGTRVSAITYISPTVNGFTGTAQWGKTKVDQIDGTQAATTVNSELVHKNLGIDYNAGALRAGVVYGEATAQAATAALMTTSPQWQGKGTVAGVSYDFGVLKAFGYYGTRSAEQAGRTSVKVDTQRVGVRVPVGKFTPFATVSTTQVDEGSTRVGDRKGVQFGTTYAFSKRTSAFAIYGKDTDDHSLAGTSAGTAAAWGASATAGTPTDSRTIRVGLAHSF